MRKTWFGKAAIIEEGALIKLLLEGFTTSFWFGGNTNRCFWRRLRAEDGIRNGFQREGIKASCSSKESSGFCFGLG